MPSPFTHSSGDVHPALSPSITTVPVTPGINLAGGSSYIQTPGQQSGETQWNTNSYFAPHDRDDAPDSPTKAVSGSRTSGELLRRLSLVDADRPKTPEPDPRVMYPSLNLSGGIISASFCIPYSLGFSNGREWVSIFKYTPENPDTDGS